MRFGGESQFGRAALGGDAFGVSPAYVCRRLLAALERFRRVGATGCLQTLDRLTGSLGDAQTWALMMQAGTPAMLVVYEGGPFTVEGTGRNNLSQKQRYSIVCIASDYRDRRRRLEGRNIYEPGLDNLTRWARYFAGRELLQISGVAMRSGKEELRVFDAEKFAGIVTFEVEATQDLYDDDATLINQLERLGICHTPSDTLQLFNDTDTPNTDDPTSPPVGYAEIGADAPDTAPPIEI